MSARHVSFLETGRAHPSAEMVARLTEALRLPLRERNALFVAAGFAPRHDERPMTAPALAAARHAVEFILNQQEPFPAFVLSRHWDLVMRNRASVGCCAGAGGRRTSCGRCSTTRGFGRCS